MPIISIIMPLYNKEKYVRKSIESILQQTFEDFELIIIDDGSTDSSLAICQSFNDSRIHITSVKNGGVSKARNIGLDYAKGNYITFIDADDYVDSHFLEKMYNRDYQVIIGGLTKVSKSYENIGEIIPNLLGSVSIDIVCNSFYNEQITSGIFGFVASKFIKREIIEKNKIRFDENIKLAEDYDFFLKVYSNIDKIYFINNCLYYYIQETENSAIMLDDSKVDFFEQIKIQQKTRNFLIKNNSFGEIENSIYLQRLTGYVYTLLINDESKNYKSFKKTYDKIKEYVPRVSKRTRGLMKIYIFLYKNNLKLICYLLLKLRKIIRS